MKKKVLFLGGNNSVAKMVEEIKKMDIYTIVADTTINAPAKNYADIVYDISPSNIKSLLEIGEHEKPDCIYAALGDVTTWNALALCKRLKVPFYVRRDKTESELVLDKFNDFCRTFNVSVINEISLYESAEEASALEFPVILRSFEKMSIYATN